MREAVQPLFLFDVDGTLMRNGGYVHLAAMAAAIREVLGIDCKVSRVGNANFMNGMQVDGMTSAEIFRSTIEQAGHGDATYRARRKELDSASARLYRSAIERGESPGEVIPGVIGTLDALYLTASTVGVLSVGARTISEAKLSAVDLRKYFEFGAFGDDALDRCELFSDALASASELTGKPWSAEQVVYVGDTAIDMASGKKFGAYTIGVATGAFSANDLRNAGANVAFETFADSASTLLKFAHSAPR